MTVKKAGDYADEILEQMDGMEKQCYIDGDCIIINVKYEYPIPLDRCKNARDILGWVDQLGEKTWVTKELLLNFIRVAVSHVGIEIHPI